MFLLKQNQLSNLIETLKENILKFKKDLDYFIQNIFTKNKNESKRFSKIKSKILDYYFLNLILNFDDDSETKFENKKNP